MRWFVLGACLEFLAGLLFGDRLALVVSVPLCLLVPVVLGLITWSRQRRCPHESYFETSGCDAVCRDCGKNLGFIGTVRGDAS